MWLLLDQDQAATPVNTFEQAGALLKFLVASFHLQSHNVSPCHWGEWNPTRPETLRAFLSHRERARNLKLGCHRRAVQNHKAKR